MVWGSLATDVPIKPIGAFSVEVGLYFQGWPSLTSRISAIQTFVLQITVGGKRRRFECPVYCTTLGFSE